VFVVTGRRVDVAAAKREIFSASEHLIGSAQAAMVPELCGGWRRG